MGLFRKTLAVSTVGMVHGSSKKQRVAQATLQATLVTATATVMQAQRAAARGDVQAKRDALLLELQALPSTSANLRRIRQIAKELKTLR